MRDFPTIIEELRSATGWKVDVIADFLGITRTTVYNWSHGDTTPSAEYRAVLSVFLDDVHDQRSILTTKEYQEWLTRTHEEGVGSYIEGLAHRVPVENQENILRRAREENGLLIETQDEEPLMYVVPFTAGALQVLVQALVTGFRNGERTEEEEAHALQVGVPPSTA